MRENNIPTPHSKPNPDEWTRTLVQDWMWRVKMNQAEFAIYIPSGVVYEPSIPTPFRGIIPADRLEPASLPHDVIYKMKGDFSSTDYRIIQKRRDSEHPFQKLNRVTRLFADNLFREILKTMNVSGWRTWLAYKAVRWFGQSAWEEKDDFQLPEKEASSE